jgi:hypothetical protein
MLNLLQLLVTKILAVTTYCYCIVSVTTTYTSTQTPLQAALWAARTWFDSRQCYICLLHTLQTGFGAHTLCYEVGTESSPFGIKLPRREAHHSLELYLYFPIRHHGTYTRVPCAHTTHASRAPACPNCGKEDPVEVRGSAVGRVFHFR